MDFLITGGAGYIGSTVASAAIDAGHRPILLDDLSTGRVEFTRGRIFYRGDIADQSLIHRIFTEFPGISGVVHCAAQIVVADSVRDPLGYYRSNVVKTLGLVESLLQVGATRLIFSSSASIYGPDAAGHGVDERSPIRPCSPYARTKSMLEEIFQDVANATPMHVVSLRYFNPVGADPQLRTGFQRSEATHVVGQLIEAAARRQPFVITGTDFPTRDGTGIRDYVHVWDLARAHVRALERFDTLFAGPPAVAINLGAGRGTTVRELLETFNIVARQPVESMTAPRRDGDPPGAWARTERAAALLGWRAEQTLAGALRDALRWHEVRPSRLPDLATAHT